MSRNSRGRVLFSLRRDSNSKRDVFHTPYLLLPPPHEEENSGETTACGNNEANDNEEAEKSALFWVGNVGGSGYSPLSAFTFITSLYSPLPPPSLFSRTVRCDTYVGASANVCFTCSCIRLYPGLRARVSKSRQTRTSICTSKQYRHFMKWEFHLVSA